MRKLLVIQEAEVPLNEFADGLTPNSVSVVTVHSLVQAQQVLSAAKFDLVLLTSPFTQSVLGDVKRDGQLHFGNLKLNLEERRCWYGGRGFELRRREFDLLAIFLRNPRKVLTRMQILSSLGLKESVGDRAVDTHMTRLRRKITLVSAGDVQLQSIYGVGYRLERK